MVGQPRIETAQSVGRPGLSQKLRPEQIATMQTWARVPETDLIKAASHVIRVTPVGSTTVTQMFELDPGITEATMTEGRGWLDPPRTYGQLAVHGRAVR